MKIILVTSDVTYCPENYNDVFEHVVHNSAQHIAGVVLVRINKIAVLAKLPYLYFAGCKNITSTLMHNIGNALSRKKQEFLKKSRIPFISVNSINDQKAILWLQAMEPDLILNLRSRCIYSDAVLKIPRLGCVNMHHGILPYQKGLFCDLYALAENQVAGFTIHLMTSRVDQGQILYQKKVAESKSYIDYLAGVASKEKLAIVKFIENATRGDFLLNDLPITGKKGHTIFTKTPNLKMIKQLQRKGMIL